MKFAKPSSSFVPKRRVAIFNPLFESRRQFFRPEFLLIFAKMWCDENPEKELIVGYKNI